MEGMDVWHARVEPITISSWSAVEVPKLSFYSGDFVACSSRFLRPKMPVFAAYMAVHLAAYQIPMGPLSLIRLDSFGACFPIPPTFSAHTLPSVPVPTLKLSGKAPIILPHL